MQQVDYEATMAKKLSIAKKIFDLEKDIILNSSTFQSFFSQNEVEPFLLYSEYYFKLCCTFFPWCY